MSFKTKICTMCKLEKSLENDFYKSRNSIRSECKKCTIERNTENQKLVRSIGLTEEEKQSKRDYMNKYYRDHKEEFVKYRLKFKQKNPNYHKEYARRRTLKRNEEMKKTLEGMLLAS